MRRRCSVLGVDAEWCVKATERNPRPEGRGGGKVSVVTVCNDTEVHVFHLTTMNSFPQALKCLLENPSILFVGHNVTDDATRLRNDWNGVDLAVGVDTMQLAKTVLGLKEPGNNRSR